MRGTKADWRLSTLLEGFLKANPDKVKSDTEKEEMKQSYTPGEDVIPKIEARSDDSDSEDERLMAHVRELSMANVGPETATREAGRAVRYSRSRRREDGDVHTQYRPEDLSRQQRPSRWAAQHAQLTESSLQQHDASESQLEHQSSLRSLLSASPIDSQDVQQEILQSIYDDGLFDGIDFDNLTTEQEEELTERIADAYRRRQREERSRNRERRRPNGRSPRANGTGEESQTRPRARTGSASAQQSRIRAPISRPHLFEQNNLEPPASPRHRHSPSSTARRTNRSASRTDAPDATNRASRSATDLSERPMTNEAARARHRRMSSNVRSTTDPQNGQMRTHISQMRANSRTSSDTEASAHPLEAARLQRRPINNSLPSLSASATNTAPAQEQTVRPATSTAAFAPEHITSVTPVPEPLTNLRPASRPLQSAPLVNCTRCERRSIQHELHYRCPWCRNGNFDLCLSCYRAGQGCDHWYGFGYMAYERWHRLAPPEGRPAGYERPHVLVPRRWQTPPANPSVAIPFEAKLQEGPFCDSCFAFANECYWYCFHCLEGAWGFCNACVQTGQTCTHPLLPIAHLSSLHHQPQQHPHDPSKLAFTQLPHLRQDSYVLLPVLTDCDVCLRPISPNNTRFHCNACSNGDYDICTDCYYGLVITGKISQANGPHGWRRCLQGHRMAIIGYQDVPEAGGQQRVIIRDQVGGRRHKDAIADTQSVTAPPPAEATFGARCLALWSYFPKAGVNDELTFPKNAEVTEVEDLNGDWSIGVYAGRVGLFPSNHVQSI